MDSDVELIAHALHMRANYIETGTVTMSATDAVAAKKHTIIRGLDLEQKKLVIQLKELAYKCIDGKLLKD